jgi:hypothetical protein
MGKITWAPRERELFGAFFFGLRRWNAVENLEKDVTVHGLSAGQAYDKPDEWRIKRRGRSLAR